MRPMQVRAVVPADITPLVDLCLAARRESVAGNQVCSPDPETVASQLSALASLPDGLLLVAHVEDELAGLLLGRLVPPGPFTDEASMTVEAVYVAASLRRRGVGHALMSAAAERAEHAGVVHVYAMPVPGARGMQRFFVRLGFGPAAGYRVAALAALRRRLASDLKRVPLRSRPGLNDLIARRRSSRAATGDLPVVGAVEPQDAAGAKIKQVNRAVHSRLASESSTTIS